MERKLTEGEKLGEVEASKKINLERCKWGTSRQEKRGNGGLQELKNRKGQCQKKKRDYL